MAPKTPKPCRAVNCGGLTIEKHGYCLKHKNLGWETHQGGKSTTQRGYGYAWQKVRKQALIRDKYLCQHCIKQGSAVAASDVDHVVAKRHGGSDDMSNLMSLCKPCHRRKTALERRK